MCLLELPFPARNSSAPVGTDMEEQKGFAELYDTDEFRLYCFKILPCSKRVPHNWQQCAFAHWGEKARRRDLRTHSYSSQLCPDAKREGGCPRGDACPMSHNIFEAWLHPELYRTQMCTSGSSCDRTVCFFAHSQSELRQPSTPSTSSQQQQQQMPQSCTTAAPSIKQQPQQGALLRSDAAAAGRFNSTPTIVPIMQPWSSSSNMLLPLASQSSNMQHQLVLNGLDALEFIPAAPSACLLGCDSLDSLRLTGLTDLTAGLTSSINSSSGWSSGSNIGCGSPTASTPTMCSGMLHGDSLSGAALYHSSIDSNAIGGSADLAVALQQLKFVPEGPASLVAPGAATAGMMFDFQDNNCYNTGFPAQQLCSSSGLAGDLALLQPSTAAAANALLLQQQCEQLQQQQMLLAQQEQMLLRQQLQIMNLGLGGQQMRLFSS